MKTVSYRGGVVRFRIPAHWIEEYEDDGGGTFYEDAPGSPTLRINVLTLESPTPVDANTPCELLGPSAEKTGQEIVRLDNGNAVIAYSEAEVEDGHALVIYFWELANVVPPRYGRVAIFSLTVLKSQQSDPEIANTIQSIDREVRASEFANDPGI